MHDTRRCMKTDKKKIPKHLGASTLTRERLTRQLSELRKTGALDTTCFRHWVWHCYSLSVHFAHANRRLRIPSTQARPVEVVGANSGMAVIIMPCARHTIYRFPCAMDRIPEPVAMGAFCLEFLRQDKVDWGPVQSCSEICCASIVDADRSWCQFCFR